MKQSQLFIIVLAIGTVAVGCNKSNPTDGSSLPSGTNSNSLSVTQQLENAKDLATNAWQKTKSATTNAWEHAKESLQSAMDYSYDKKDAFVAQASTNLATIDQKIKELSDKAATASDSAKADAQAKIQALREQRAVLNQKLDALKNATAADWDAVKADFTNAYDQMKTSCQEAWQWLTDKLRS